MSLTYSSRNCWEIYNGSKDRKAMQELADRYLDFLSHCKTERETTEYVHERLARAGYTDNVKNTRFMRSLQGKSIFAIKKGKAPLARGIRLVCAHADSPRLDLKQRPLQEQAGIAQAKTHYYGGIRKYQWLARPLALHGVVVKQDGTVVKVTLGEDPHEPVFTISDLLPHLAKDQADKPLATVFEGEKLNLVFGHEPYPKDKAAKAASKNEKTNGADKDNEAKDPIKYGVLKILNEKYGIVEEDLYSAELQAVPAGPARYVGLDSSLIGGYGQDDRICIFTALEALLSEPKSTPAVTQCIMFWDKEEIGSEGSTGAKSRFFEYCIQDVIAAWEPRAPFSSVMMGSKAISADVHAAIDPDWQELHEKLNAATIGHGPTFCKFTGHRGKYEANDAHPEYIGWLRGVLNKQGIPWQMAELGKVDGGGGGTVAMHLAAYGMNIIDGGPPVLSMHSPFEIASKMDLYSTMLAYSAFFQAT